MNEMNATATLDDMAATFDLAAAAPPAMHATVEGFRFGDLLLKAQAFRKVLTELRAAGVSDKSIADKIGEILNVIIENLPDILAIVKIVLALFGL